LHRRRLCALATATVAAILSLASAAAAARSYSVTDLGDLGGGSTHPNAINDAGMVTGESTRVDHPSSSGGRRLAEWREAARLPADAARLRFRGLPAAWRRGHRPAGRA